MHLILNTTRHDVALWVNVNSLQWIEIESVFAIKTIKI